MIFLSGMMFFFQRFDTVDWATGKASGL